ncbi:hypothetical protein BRC81_12605 [Halobacteriales archaeon QS_1_68_20]|nr:MAG: hypothetical protein BRC81_12605 [Halobacteriales archaeon QS_1_68_20]
MDQPPHDVPQRQDDQCRSERKLPEESSDPRSGKQQREQQDGSHTGEEVDDDVVQREPLGRHWLRG